MIKKTFFLCTFFMALNGHLLFAAGAIPSFKEANQLYAAGKFADAASAYQKLAQSQPRAEIYYNLGNAYFKNNQLGNAILNYERAKRLDPRDPDIRSNLSYANRLIEYRIEDKRDWYLHKIAAAVDYLKFQECWLVFLVFYSIFIMILLISLIRKRSVFGKLGTTFLFIAIVSLFPLLLKATETGMKEEAIVTVKQTEVRYGPSTIDRIAFRLVEGLKVSIQDRQQDWYRIRLRDGRSGWARDSELSVI